MDWQALSAVLHICWCITTAITPGTRSKAQANIAMNYKACNHYDHFQLIIETAVLTSSYSHFKPYIKFVHPQLHVGHTSQCDAALTQIIITIGSVV